MNILISAPYYPTYKVPYGAFIEVVAHEFSRRGHTVSVIAPQSITSCIKHKIPFVKTHYFDCKEDGCKIEIFRPLSITLGRGKLKKISNYIDKKIINRFLMKSNQEYDLIYSHFWWSAYCVMDFVKSKKIPHFVATGEDKITIHNYLSYNDINNLTSTVNGIISVSTKNKTESQNAGLVNSIPVLVAPNAVSPEFLEISDPSITRDYLNIKSSDFVVAFCGRFSSRKGINRLDEALKKINNKNIKAIYIGSESEGENIDLNYSGIVFKGSVPHNKISSYLRCADVFILPSLAEGCSNAIVEAMSCGLPIISSDLPFNYDILDSNNSILIDPLNIKEIEKALLTIMNNPIKKIEMGKYSKNKMSDLTIENRVNKILSFIELNKSTIK